MPAPSARPSWRRALAGGAVVLALSGLAACGGGDDSSSKGSGTFAVGGDSSSSSSSSAPAAPDVKPGDTVSQDDVASMLKTATTSMKTAHVKMDMGAEASGQSMSITAEGDMQVSPLAEHLTMSLAGQKIETIMVDNVMYMKSPMLGGGNKWAKTDLSKALGSSGLSDAMSNPLSLIDNMADAVKSATFKGDEQVGGVDAKHYTLVVDGKKLMSSMGSAASSAPVSGDITQDMWLDSKGRMVQSKTGMGSTGDVTMNLSDFDKDVSISAPPSSQVTELPVP